MSVFGVEVVEAARSHVGEPFRHHFEPDICEGGAVTLDSCMERGMDSAGFDCSGLVIASVCDVLDIQPEEWPRDYRHIRQFEALADDQPTLPGDVLLIDSRTESGRQHRTHVGIVSGPETIIHANGLTAIVEEGWTEEIVTGVRSLPILTLASLTLSLRR